ncbi:MAG: formate/nitrite transporter family protein [Atopobiaceae bacterium]
MYAAEVTAASKAAAGKKAMVSKNPAGYFVLSMLAGAYIGFGNLLINVIGGQLQGAPYTKVVMGVSFGIALSLVVIAGSELFTGNTMVMSLGIMKKTVTLGDAAKVWIVCWLGNLAGAVVLAVLFHFSGLNGEATSTFLATAAAGKMGTPFIPLFIRGILCNILVCLAVWCAFRTTNDVAKLIMVFWCLFAFITCGFEHSIANMTQLTVALLDPAGQAVSLGGYFYNLITVTLGNMVGGICFVAAPYFLGQKND